MLEQGIIRHHQIWVVHKKPDTYEKIKWRIVIDDRKVNEKPIDEKYSITDVLDKFGTCHYFTTLELANRFLQIEMAEEDIEKTVSTITRSL